MGHTGPVTGSLYLYLNKKVGDECVHCVWAQCVAFTVSLVVCRMAVWCVLCRNTALTAACVVELHAAHLRHVCHNSKFGIFELSV